VKTFRDESPHDLLGVAPNASPEEIRQALDRLGRILAPGSLALYSVLAREEQRELQESVQLAAALLLARHAPRERFDGRDAEPAAAEVRPHLRLAEPPPALDENAPAPERHDAERSPGARLRAAREAVSLTLRDVAQRTRIPLAQLAAIEEEAFDRLPRRAYLRGFVMTYAQLLKLDSEAAWDSYRARWEAAGYGGDGAPAR
jgi:hypothetical protein